MMHHCFSCLSPYLLSWRNTPLGYIIGYGSRHIYWDFVIYAALCFAGIALCAALYKGKRHPLLVPLAMECHIVLILWGGLLLLSRTIGSWYDLSVRPVAKIPLAYHGIPLYLAGITLFAAHMLKRSYDAQFRVPRRFVVMGRCAYLFLGAALVLAVILNIAYWYMCEKNPELYYTSRFYPFLRSLPGRQNLWERNYFLLAVISWLFYTGMLVFAWKRNMGFQPVTVGYLKQTGFCSLRRGADETMQKNDSSWKNEMEIPEPEIQQILDFLPGLHGRRLTVFERLRTVGRTAAKHGHCPELLRLDIAYGENMNLESISRFHLVKRKNRCIALLHKDGWYQLEDAETLIQALLKYCPSERGR